MSSDTKICRYCGNIIYSDAETCAYCGKYLLKEHDNPDLYCAKCKAPVNTDDNFCQKCGAVFNTVPEELQNLTDIKHNINGIPYNLIIFFTSFAVSIAMTVFHSVGNEVTIGSIFVYWGIAFLISEISLYLYFLPSILAFENNNPNAYFIYVCNLCFGITIIGWFITLTFGMKSNKPPQL